VTTIDAVYRDGALHPVYPLPLADGTPVRVTVEPANSSPSDGRSVYDILTAITARSVPPAQPDAPPDDGSVNHDKYLYGQPEARGDVR
jgi:predicted DNA-binding antitoxin AbrB/MazE fold protein